MQFLYRDGSEYIFMDTASYEQLQVETALLGDSADYLKEGDDAVLEFFGDEHRQRGRHALAHLGFVDHHGCQPVGIEPNPAERRPVARSSTGRTLQRLEPEGPTGSGNRDDTQKIRTSEHHGDLPNSGLRPPQNASVPGRGFLPQASGREGRRRARSMLFAWTQTQRKPHSG